MKNDDAAPLLIRRIKTSDLAAVLRLVLQIESSEDLVVSARSQFCRELESRDFEHARFVVEARGEIVGTMGCGRGPFPSPRALWADWLIVDAQRRRQRIASLLYGEVESFALSLGKKHLCLDIGNVCLQRAAYLFHLRNGFQIVGKIPDYWGESEDLNIMTKTLISKDRH